MTHATARNDNCDAASHAARRLACSDASRKATPRNCRTTWSVGVAKCETGLGMDLPEIVNELHCFQFVFACTRAIVCPLQPFHWNDTGRFMTLLRSPHLLLFPWRHHLQPSLHPLPYPRLLPACRWSTR